MANAEASMGYRPVVGYSVYKRLALNHAHPTKFLLDLTGFIWALYFMWQNNFAAAIFFGFGFAAVGSLLTLNANTEELSKTALGKYVVARLHPANTLFQVIGYVVLLAGTWTHEGWMIFSGLTLIILGHLWGWKGSVIP